MVDSGGNPRSSFYRKASSTKPFGWDIVPGLSTDFLTLLEKLAEEKNMRNKWILLLVVLLLFGCHSKKNKTEERARQRVTEFVYLALTEQWEPAEAYLSRGLLDSENKEVFFSNFDTKQLKDTSQVEIIIESVYIPENDPRQRALVSLSIRNAETNYTKMASMPIIYERGDWHIGQ